MGKKYEPPSLKPSKGDATHTIARAGLSALPGVGGPATELLNAVLTPPLILRQQRWREEVASAIRRLEERDSIDLTTLSQNEQFIDVVFQATHIALRTSKDEKIEALRATIENSPIEDSPDDSLQHMFLNLIDTFTVWHIRILKFFDNPVDWFHKQGQKPREYAISSSLSQILFNAFPELGTRREFYDQIWKDLYSRGLVNTDGLHTMMSARGVYDRRTTPLAQEFLRFITERPKEIESEEA